MIGGLTSGLSTALRTATTARATMDDMTRQIATGKRVASVKDDGAAWARAAGLASRRVEAETRRDVTLPTLTAVIHTQNALDSNIADALTKLGDIVRQAMTHPAGSSARQTLAAEYASTIAALNQTVAPSGAITGGIGMQADGRWGIVGPTNDPLTGAITVWTTLNNAVGSYAWQNGDWSGNGMPFGSVDILNHGNAQLATGLSTIQNFRDTNISNATAMNGRVERRFEMARRITEGDIDRLETQIGALVDADLGAASAARAQAETRQALAMQTVRMALDAYSAKATGLLANVQRTQRSVMA